jgi:hypothetical protein
MLSCRIPNLGIGIIEGEERPKTRTSSGAFALSHALVPALPWMSHWSNGGKRDAITGGQMRALGVKPGVPDLLMPVPIGPNPGLALEFKSAVSRASESQDEWMRFLMDQAGRMVLIARSAEEARRAVQLYLDVDLPEVPG